MANTKPKRATLKDQNGNELPDSFTLEIGLPLQLQADGESNDTAAGQETSALIRLFYRVNGIPKVIVLYNGRVEDGFSGTKEFRTFANKVGIFHPLLPGDYSIKIVAWDHKNKPTSADQIKLRTANHLLRVRHAP